MSSIIRAAEALAQRAKSIEPPVRRPAFEEPLNVIHFVTGPDFLNRTIYPAQATALKVITLAAELVTPFDDEVIGEWMGGFALTSDGTSQRWEGQDGTPGDLMERIAWCRANQRPWFREVLLIVGRRGGKGVLGAYVIAWVLWQLLSKRDPQEHYGVARNKRLTIPIYAGNRDQAERNQFADVLAVVRDSDCFEPFIASIDAGSFRLYTPRQVMGGITDPRRALIDVRAAQTTGGAPRGPTSPMFAVDEMAHIRGAGSTASSTELYAAAMQTIAQFPVDGLALQTSSPWDRTGQLFSSYAQALRVDPETQTAPDKDMFVLQLPSWGLYRDFERASSIPMWPKGPNFKPLRSAPMTFDDAARREEAANPETFAVERRSLWRSSQQAYIRPGFIEGLLRPWRGATLQMQHIGRLGRVYAAHADPSVSQANFGFAIAHIEMDDDGIEHVVYDLLHAWRPVDFEAGWVNYPLITDQIFDYVRAFNIAELTYDQYSSVGEIQRLRARIIDAQLPVRTNVHQRPATAGLNFNAYEAFKTALGHGIVHAPPFALAVAELGALEMIGTKVVCQTTGPVTTKDVADALVQVFWTLLGHRSADLFDRLARTPLRGSQPAFGPARIREPIFDQFSEFSRSRRSGRLNGSNPARGRHRN